MSFLLLISTLAFASPDMPTENVRASLISKLVSEIDRLDGEGLIPRKNRPEPWHQTTKRLEIEAAKAKNPKEFGQVLKRLDATYPNLHAHVSLAPDYDLNSEGSLNIAVTFRPDGIVRGQSKFRYYISSVRSTLYSGQPENAIPAVGDEVQSINGKDIETWQRENLIFCKFPLREQCADEFFDNFRHEILGWNRTLPLSIKISRKGISRDVVIPVELKSPAERSTKPARTSDACDEGIEYLDFQIVYRGFNACILENKKDPRISLWRIRSFAYPKSTGNGNIDSLQKEVDLVWSKYWKDRKPASKKVIFDVVENGGGDSPVGWYKLFFGDDFQEQYFELRKITELESPEIRSAIFYGDRAHEAWFEKIKVKGVYDKTKLGDFLPTQPQFCADPDQDCSATRFHPIGPIYKGEVRIVVDQFCISSCVGFVWEFKNILQDRVRLVGFPDSADSAYARVYVDGFFDKKQKEGFRISVNGREGQTRQSVPEDAIFRGQISVTRSTDSDGRILSGIPVPIDFWISPELGDREKWRRHALETAVLN